jgi:hypothetical protein
METVLIIFSFAVLTFAVSEFAARPQRDIWRSL